MPKETLTVYHKSAAHPKQPALGHIKPADIPDSKPPADHPSLQSACPPLFRPNIRFSIATYEDEMRHPSTLQLRFGIPIPTVPELDRFVRRLGLIHRDMPGETKGEWRLQGGHLPGDTVIVPGLQCPAFVHIPLLMRASQLKWQDDGSVALGYCVLHSKQDSRTKGKYLQSPICPLPGIIIRQLCAADISNGRVGPIFASEIPENIQIPEGVTVFRKLNITRTKWEPETRDVNKYYAPVRDFDYTDFKSAATELVGDELASFEELQAQEQDMRDAAANQAAARRQTRKRTGNANGPSGSTVGVSETIRAGTEELKEGKPKLEDSASDQPAADRQTRKGKTTADEPSGATAGMAGMSGNIGAGAEQKKEKKPKVEEATRKRKTNADEPSVTTAGKSEIIGAGAVQIKEEKPKVEEATRKRKTNAVAPSGNIGAGAKHIKEEKPKL